MKRTRVFSFLLALVMIIALLPVSALAVTTISNVTVNFPAPAHGEKIDSSNISPVLSFGSNAGKINADVGEWTYNGNPLGTPMYSNFGFPSRIECTAILSPASGYQFTSSTKVEVHDTNYGIEGDPDMLYCNKEYQSDGTIKVTIHLYFPDRYRSDFYERLRARELPLSITTLPQIGWTKSQIESSCSVWAGDTSDYYSFDTTSAAGGCTWREFGRLNGGLPEEAYSDFNQNNGTLKAGMLIYTSVDIELVDDGDWWRLGIRDFLFPGLWASQPESVSALITYPFHMSGTSATITDLSRARVYVFYRVPGATHIDQVNLTFDDFKPIDNPDASSGYQLSEFDLILPNFEITNNVHCSMSPEYLESYEWYGFTEGPEGIGYPEGDYMVTLCLDVEDGYYIDENTVINIVGRHGQPAYAGPIKAQYGFASCNVTYHARDYAALEIAEQPWDDYVDLGETISATVIAYGVGLTYQWYFKDPGASSFTKSSNTTNTYSTTMTEAKNGRQVYCVIKDSSGGTVTSRTATLWAFIPLTIITQPKSVSVPLGQTASTTVVAKGSDLHYTWYFKDAGSSSFKKSSNTTATYSTEMTAARDGRQVYCIVTSDIFEDEVKTDTVTLSMQTGTPLSITTQPKSTSAVMGATATVKVVASGEGLTYQWYLKNKGKTSFSKSSNTTATYTATMSNTVNGRQIYCIVKDKDGNTVKTNTVWLLSTTLAIVQQPKNASAAEGATIKASVVASGEGLTYQWYIKNKGKTSFSKSSNTTATYTATMSDVVNGRQLYCVVKDKNGNTVTSATVTFTRN
jgi:hypothetical protein